MARRRNFSNNDSMLGPILYFPLILIILIIIFVTDTESRPLVQPILIAVAIFLTIIAGVITMIMMVNRNKKRREFMRQIQAIEEGETDTPPLSEELLEEPTINERISRRVVKKKRKLVLNYQKKKLVFKGELKGEKCPICKLDLREDQEILVCPQCKTPFHENHLILWIDKENSCPVCGEAYAIINREKEIRTKKE
ncbi:MAG: RING finger protein [Candidatus Heimdallarchaeota archaeon]